MSLFNIQLINNKQVLEDFLTSVKPPTFLQSWEWGEFNNYLNHHSFRVGIYDSAYNLAGIALIITIKARRGKFLFCPHGPVVQPKYQDKYHDMLDAFMRYLVVLAKREKCYFIRISPLCDDNDDNKKIFTSLRLKPAPIHLMHPELSWILDVNSDVEALLKGMRKTTRYCINKSIKEGVKIIRSQKIEDIEIFYKLYQKTVARQQFIPFSKQYLTEEFKIFLENDHAMLFFAQYQNHIISSAFVIFNPWSAFYHHGGSDNEFNKIPASYLLQWDAIRTAKDRGCRFYNFWGIAPENEKKHPWAGLSLFKKGFGGYSEKYLHCQDYIISPLYWISYSIEKIRRRFRHL